jgi:hypothetical protein
MKLLFCLYLSINMLAACCHGKKDSNFCRRRIVFEGDVKNVLETTGGNNNPEQWAPASVIKIGEMSACSDSLKMLAIEVESRLQKIERSAFADSILCSIVIPRSVLILGSRCFFNCKQLVCAMFEQGSQLRRIEKNAFAATALTVLVLPASVSEISSQSLSSMCYITFSGQPQVQALLDNYGATYPLHNQNMLFNVDDNNNLMTLGHNLVTYSCILSRDLVVSDDICMIADDAFSRNTSIDSIIFGSGQNLRRIGCCAFWSSSLKVIKILSSIESLGKNCFGYCRSLESVTFEPNSKLQEIEACSFFSCSLTSITIPKSIRILGDHCFCNCKKLTSIIFEKGSRLKKIDTGAFDGAGLLSILIPQQVTTLGEACFSGCKSLKQVKFEQRSMLQTIEEYTFWDTGLERLIIPASVENLHAKCCQDCQNLKQIILNSSRQLLKARKCAEYCPSISTIIILSED